MARTRRHEGHQNGRVPVFPLAFPQPEPQDSPVVGTANKTSPATPHGRLFSGGRPRELLPDEPVETPMPHGDTISIPAGRVLNRDQELNASQEKMDRLTGIFEVLQNGAAAIQERLQASVPTWITEWGYLANGTFLSSQDSNVAGAKQGAVGTLSPQTSLLEKIESVSAFIPAGATGTLTLGSITIPVGSPAATSWTGTAPCLTLINQTFLLQPSDVRSLSSSSAGIIALILCGQVAPTRGRLSL